MDKRQITHDNHTVPQFYLRRWSNDGVFVNCYNTIRYHEGQRPWSYAAIKSVSVWRDIYTQIKDGHEDDSIELFFCRCEERASRAVEELESCDKLDKVAMVDLVEFAIAQMVRTPKWHAEQNSVIANIVESAVEETYREVLQKARAGMLGPTSHMEEYGTGESDASPFPPPPFETSIDEDKKELITTFPIGQRSALFAMGRALNGEIANAMRAYPWTLLRFPDELNLPTSDNPFTRLMRLPNGTYTTTCGVGVKDALLFMPITPHWLLATEVGYGKIEQSKLDNQAVCALIVRAIVENADRYIYSRSRDSIIELIRPSEVNPQRLQELDELRKAWLGT